MIVIYTFCEGLARFKYDESVTESLSTIPEIVVSKILKMEFAFALHSYFPVATRKEPTREKKFIIIPSTY